MNDRLKDLIVSRDAEFFGVADLSLVSEDIASRGGPSVVEFPRAISIGMVLPHAIVNQLPRRTESFMAAVNYRLHAYDVINERLDQIASRLTSFLQNAGYIALPVPAAKQTDTESLSSFFSHKMAAHLAGLGWIGKNCLLITPEVGPRVRWTSVLTDAPLNITGEPIAERCGNCKECVDICPTGAITGRSFQEEDPRDIRLDAHKCDRYIKEMESVIGLPVCGMCLYACPFGRR